MAQGEARRAAVRLILGVTGEGRPLSEQLQAGALAALDPPDRARAQRLAAVTLRHWQAAGRTLAPFLRRGPPPEVAAILRLAVCEMLAEGVPPHDVVNASVALVRAGGARSEGFAGLVNAVLRKAGAEGGAAWARQPADELPGWLRGRLMSAYGKRAVQAIEAAHRMGAPIDVTPKDPRMAEALAARLGARRLPTGSLRLEDPGQVSALPGFAEGEWWVQDAAAAIPARLLGAAAGRRVLDLCAAPGGKTLQLAAAGAEVTALDLSAPRMERVAQNLRRCGMTARTVVADALTWEAPSPYDAVLLDAPCSATGTVRRHPDLPFVKSPEMLKGLVALQAQLLDRAAGFLRPGGRLVYATCSLLPDEGERQITAVLGRHPDLRQEPIAAPAGIDPAWIVPGGGLRLRPDYWPELGGMDGFYIAVLRRED